MRKEVCRRLWSKAELTPYSQTPEAAALAGGASVMPHVGHSVPDGFPGEKANQHA